MTNRPIDPTKPDNSQPELTESSAKASTPEGDPRIRRKNNPAWGNLRWVVNFVRHAMRPSELINPVAFVQMLPGRCTPVQLAAAACCKKFLYIQ